jgi:hypothetical protein
MNKIKGWIGELTDIAVALVALGVAAGRSIWYGCTICRRCTWQFDRYDQYA